MPLYHVTRTDVMRQITMVVLRNGRNTHEVAVRAPIPPAKRSRVKKAKVTARLSSSEYIGSSEGEDMIVVVPVSRCGDLKSYPVLTVSVA